VPKGVRQGVPEGVFQRMESQRSPEGVLMESRRSAPRTAEEEKDDSIGLLRSPKGVEGVDKE